MGLGMIYELTRRFLSSGDDEGRWPNCARLLCPTGALSWTPGQPLPVSRGAKRGARGGGEGRRVPTIAVKEEGGALEARARRRESVGDEDEEQ